MVGVDAEEDLVECWVGADVLDGGEDAGELFGGGEGAGVRSCGLSADVKDGDAVEEEGVELREEGEGLESFGVLPVFRERVGG